MYKLIELKKEYDLLVSSTITNYLNPTYVYIPIDESKGLNVSKNDSVLIGTNIYEGNSYVTSPISGTISQIVEVNTISGKTLALQIENNYQESSKHVFSTLRNYRSLTKDKLLKKLTDNHLNIDFTNHNTLIINAIDADNYILTQSYTFLNNCQDFLELLDYLANIFNLNVIICASSSAFELVNKINEIISRFTNITLSIIPNLYLIDEEVFLKDYLNFKEALVIKSTEFYDIYNILKKNKPKSDKLITITGTGITNPQVILCKIGSRLVDIINEHIKLVDNDVVYIANSLVRGSIIDINALVVSDDLMGILIMKPKKTKKPSKCIKCGACFDICPVSINPFKKTDKCINCNLCSYICPVYINFSKEGEAHE